MALLFLGAAFMAYVSNPHPSDYYDYTFRIAGALLHGKLGMTERPPDYLNEMVPFDGSYFSVFPLGSVLCMLPAAALGSIGLVTDFPARSIAALIAGVITLLSYLLAGPYGLPRWRRILFCLAPFFGTCLWANLVYGGAWQVALGLAVAGEMGALYFLLVRPRPLLAGGCFAIAFGNRTEILLVAPVLYYLLLEEDGFIPKPDRESARKFLGFSLLPLCLGLLTLAYNAARFHSPWDFGYARIPGVLEEPWYRDGIFSIKSIPLNLYKMLFEPWKLLDHAPWLVPTGFGGSVFLFSPFLVLLLRKGALFPALSACSWISICVLTLLLWIHGNYGGWQVSYRYATILIPWAYLILLGSSRTERVCWETTLVLLSMVVNGYATWLFCRTQWMSP
jgi:hypothetical protein